MSGRSAADVLRGKFRDNRGRPPWELGAKGLAFTARTGRSRWQLRHASSVGIGVRILGLAPLIHNRGTLKLGNEVKLEAPIRRIYFNVWPGAELILGDEVEVNDGARFDCTCSVQIGDRVRVGFGAVILDNHFHTIEDRLLRPAGQPVVLEDDVWVAANTMILAGVRVGEGSVVAAGSVVPRDVPPLSVVAGSPARVIEELDPDRLVRRGKPRR